MILIQLTLVAAGFYLGGPATKAGGAFLLAGVAAFGIAVGWWAYGKAKGGNR